MRNYPAAGALVISMALFLSGCDGNPMGPIAGGALSGEPQSWPESWAFTDRVENIFLETDPDDPYSVTLWGVACDEHFYIAGASDESTWVANLLKDPRVKLAVEDQLFVARVEQVNEPEELAAVLQAYVAKYEIETDEGSNFIEEGGILFRLHQP